MSTKQQSVKLVPVEDTNVIYLVKVKQKDREKPK